jgi:hypothetical protein
MKAFALRAFAWANSRQGRHDIGAFAGACAALYASLHGAGVL